MKTPKEKAENMIELFIDFPFDTSTMDAQKRMAKQCALICVNEIINNRQPMSISLSVASTVENNPILSDFSKLAEEEMQFLKKVKQEIEKL